MLLEPVHNYCERTSAELWAEPLNAVTNAAFFLTAWLLYKSYRHTAEKNYPSFILILLIALVGLGSTLFHTFANRLTMLGDIIPIAMFTFYYLWVALRRLIGLSLLPTYIWMIVFTVVSMQMPHIPEPYRFNGSVGYFPCLTALLLIGGYLRYQSHPAALYILKAVLCFLLSLTFRSLDFALCPTLPIGTHFVWHCINGAVLYLLTKPVIGVKYR